MEPITLHITTARNLWTRAVGLLGKQSLANDEGLLIVRCPSIHTWFMRFSIDAVFLDRLGIVTHVAEKVAPWRFVLGRGAFSCLELSAGTAARLDIRAGQQFETLSANIKADYLQLRL